MKTPHTPRAIALAATAFAALFGASTAQAVDFDGYFRAGPGATKKDAARACYNLAGTSYGGHYRLGNECDFYGEFGLTQVGTVGGVEYKAKVMFNEYNGGTDIGNSYSSFEQMYVEGKGFDISPTTNFWIGKRFYGRNDIHIMDKFFINESGVGAGAEFVMPVGKMGLAYFTDDGGTTGASKVPGLRLNVDYTGITVNPGGTLRVVGTYTKGNYDSVAGGKGTNGYGLTFEHTQDIAAIGGKNTLWLQFAEGSAGLNANFAGGQGESVGNTRSPTSMKKWRIVESPNWQVGPFGGQATLLYGKVDKDDINLTAGWKEFTIGGRGSFAVTNNFKLVAEAGYMTRKPDDNSTGTQKLAKFTFAPTLSTGPDFWNRPELRLYVTTAKWNSAANTAAGPNGLTGIGDGKRNGTSYGAQVEIWW